MTDAQKRAINKTAITVLMIIALFYIISIYPFLIGYLLLAFFITTIAFFITTIVGIIYLFFAVWEEQKDWNKLK